MEGSILSDEMRDLKKNQKVAKKEVKSFKDKEKQILDIDQNIDEI
jgi:hypothetical protein